jgi:hypothetical protein
MQNWYNNVKLLDANEPISARAKYWFCPICLLNRLRTSRRLRAKTVECPS